ncbi:hypothetical protein [Phycicoccus flavus]|uniref:hypothetical protein n=1 Tax=Phycicoccus flavus TaxID=2502783 RepID=UPI000FEC1D5D|nr:hypothetical protein [Phycicoccus flavus]NHA69487.1 hypothetical protein [Phycicoccus flavus]
MCLYRRLGGRRLTVLGLTVALGAATLAALPTTPANAAAGDCRLVELAPPAGGFDAGVIDIEVVAGSPTYYGNYQLVEDDGQQHQRAVVWTGLGGAPRRVDPGLGGTDDIAYELTSNGLLNGETWFADGATRSWVHDLRTGSTTVVRSAPGDAPDRIGAWVRRINSAGQATGARETGNGTGGRKQAFDALAWDHYTQAPRSLPFSGNASSAPGLDESGDRSGFVGKQEPGISHWSAFVPTIWRADGSTTTMARLGLDAIPFLLADDDTAGGEGASSFDPATLHFEAVFWPSPREIVGLGVLEGGDYSRVYGLDEGGWAVGAAFQPWDGPESMVFEGEVARSFLYRHGVTTPGTIEVLPTLWSVRHGVTDPQRWFGSAVHAVNRPLDQVASTSHSGYRADGSARFGATVYTGASHCGVEVATTHDPYGLGVGEPVPTTAGIDAARSSSARHGAAAVRPHR